MGLVVYLRVVPGEVSEAFSLFLVANIKRYSPVNHQRKYLINGIFFPFDMKS